jgi:hypothetical protein
MSEPKRYEPSSHYSADFGMAQSPVGKWVSYEDYARLKAEVHRLEEIVGSDAIDRKYGMCCDASDEHARLKAEVERLTAFTTRTIIPNEELQAKVERLTKAGDAMWNALLCSGCSECMGMYDCHDEAMKLWNDAKKGGQP